MQPAIGSRTRNTMLSDCMNVPRFGEVHVYSSCVTRHHFGDVHWFYCLTVSNDQHVLQKFFHFKPCQQMFSEHTLK